MQNFETIAGRQRGQVLQPSMPPFSINTEDCYTRTKWYIIQGTCSNGVVVGVITALPWPETPNKILPKRLCKELLGPFNFGPRRATGQLVCWPWVFLEGGRRWKIISHRNTSEQHHLLFYLSLCEQYHIGENFTKGSRYLHVKTIRGHHKRCLHMSVLSDCYGSVPSMWSLLQSKGYDIIDQYHSIYL